MDIQAILLERERLTRDIHVLRSSLPPPSMKVATIIKILKWGLKIRQSARQLSPSENIWVKIGLSLFASRFLSRFFIAKVGMKLFGK